MWRLHRIGQCPSCGSQRVYRSRRRGVAERMLFRLLLVRPYRCESCDVRFYGYRKRFEVHLAGDGGV